MYIARLLSPNLRTQNGVSENRHFEIQLPVSFMSDGIYWNRSNIACVNKILQRMWRVLVVQGVIVNRVSHCTKIRPKNGLTSQAYRASGWRERKECQYHR